MPQINNIEITEDDISYAESILLKDGQTFDDERREFIKNLETIDLQAVPGSGKTTALLAKLLILEKKMPFSDGSGILVLSHTNTAVDEIKDKLGKVAPKLFEFPNFIGTIQEFVNKFLAKPYGINYLGIKFQHIDTDYYENLCYEPRSARGWLARRDKEKLLKKTRIQGEIISMIDGNFPLTNNNTQTYKAFLEMKKNILNKGIIAYDEAYYYGNLYIRSNPTIIKILQNRFKYIFIDEMQDMQKHQVDILEKLFYDEGNSISILQRIGDTNQAIYDGKVSEECMWKGRDEITGYLNDKLKIIGSHRFTEKISNIVKCFGLTNNQLNGKREIKNSDNEDASIKPILLVYKDCHLNNSEVEPKVIENKVLERFSNIIKDKIEDGYFKDVDKIISKAIIWNAKSQDSGFNLDQCRAKHYFYDYDIVGSKSKNKTWLKSEKDYLFYYDKNDKTYKSKYNSIINLFLKILRVHDIKNINDKYFNKNSLFKYLRENFEKEYINFKEELFGWSKKLANSNINEIAEQIDIVFPRIIKLLPGNKNINLKIKDSDLTEGVIVNDCSSEKTNVYSNDGIEINVCNVHSVKGETHTCTLYLETCYHPPSRGEDRINKGYECIRLKKRFLGDISRPLSKTYDIQSSKMLYVGLSRPTHLLCYAIHEERFNKLREVDKEKLNDLWDIGLV